MIAMTQIGDFLTISQVAAIFGISPGRVRQLITDRRARLTLSRKVGRDWVIAREELDLLRPGPTGRPKKGAPIEEKKNEN